MSCSLPMGGEGFFSSFFIPVSFLGMTYALSASATIDSKKGFSVLSSTAENLSKKRIA